MDRFNSIFTRTVVILILVAFLILWVTMAGPNAFDSGPVGVTVFTFVTLAIILTVINIGYRTIKRS